LYDARGHAQPWQASKRMNVRVKILLFYIEN
jgi:hypothetical protein